jgi:cobalt/nickel transport system permease protein
LFALTFGVVTYLQRANLPLLRLNHRAIAAGGEGAPATAPRRSRVRRLRPALIAFGIGALLTPLGLLAPGHAFGEDAPGNLDLHRYHLAAGPDGLARYAGFWHHALFTGYGFQNDAHPVVGYIVSALVGMAAVAVVGFVVAALVARVRSAAR